MWIKKFLIRILKRNFVCDKCGYPSKWNFHCKICQEYINIIEMKNKKEREDKENLNRRNWIETRDKFLNNQNGG